MYYLNIKTNYYLHTYTSQCHEVKKYIMFIIIIINYTKINQIYLILYLVREKPL